MSLLLNLILRLAGENADRLGPWLVRSASRLLPSSCRAEILAEWLLSDERLADRPTTRLLHAIGLFRASVTISVPRLAQVWHAEARNTWRMITDAHSHPGPGARSWSFAVAEAGAGAILAVPMWTTTAVVAFVNIDILPIRLAVAAWCARNGLGLARFRWERMRRKRGRTLAEAVAEETSTLGALVHDLVFKVLLVPVVVAGIVWPGNPFIVGPAAIFWQCMVPMFCSGLMLAPLELQSMREARRVTVAPNRTVATADGCFLTDQRWLRWRSRRS